MNSHSKADYFFVAHLHTAAGTRMVTTQAVYVPAAARETTVNNAAKEDGSMPYILQESAEWIALGWRALYEALFFYLPLFSAVVLGTVILLHGALARTRKTIA